MLTPRFLAQVADSLEPPTTPQGVGEEGQVGCGHEGGPGVDMLSFGCPWRPQERVSNKYLM